MKGTVVCMQQWQEPTCPKCMHSLARSHQTGDYTAENACQLAQTRKKEARSRMIWPSNGNGANPAPLRWHGSVDALPMPTTTCHHQGAAMSSMVAGKTESNITRGVSQTPQHHPARIAATLKYLISRFKRQDRRLAIEAQIAHAVARFGERLDVQRMACSLGIHLSSAYRYIDRMSQGDDALVERNHVRQGWTDLLRLRLTPLGIKAVNAHAESENGRPRYAQLVDKWRAALRRKALIAAARQAPAAKSENQKVSNTKAGNTSTHADALRAFRRELFDTFVSTHAYRGESAWEAKGRLYPGFCEFLKQHPGWQKAIAIN